MLDSLRQLLAEQTTAAELAAFILVVTVLCVLSAAVIYVLIMTAVWMIRLRARLTWRQVVVPDLIRFRRFTWEYVLALATSAVLALTLAEKHDIVEEVLNQPADELIGTHLLNGVLPLHRSPTVEEMGGPGTPQAEELAAYLEGRASAVANLSLAALLRPPLLAGRDGDVRTVVDDVLRTVLERDPDLRARVRQGLFVACLLLFAAYLGWYARGRTRALARPNAEQGGGEGEMVRRLALIGVCLALLLATPALARDPEILTDSAVAAIRRREPAPGLPATVDTLLRRAVDSQYDLQGALRALADFRDSATVMGAIGGLSGRLTVLDGSIADLAACCRTHSEELTMVHADLGRLAEQLTGHERALAGLTGRLDALAGDVVGLGQRVDRNSRAVEALAQRLGTMAARLDSAAAQARQALGMAREADTRLNQRLTGEYLLVEVGAQVGYAVYGQAGQIVARGTDRGIHRLPAGTYVVTAGAGRRQVNLQEGAPQWVTVAAIQ